MTVYERIFMSHGFSKTQDEILKIVGRQKKILEIGPSSGYMTRAFLDNGCTVDVVEADKEAIAKLPKKVRRKISGSIEDNKIFNLLDKDYDFIILADVLEHLVNPELVLKKLLAIAAPNTKLLISLPNIACWVMRKQLFFQGDFEYQMSGLLDKTHLHFYTVNTLPKLLAESGWKVDKIIGTITRLPFEDAIRKIPILRWIFDKLLYQKLVEKYQNLSYYHFLAISSK